MNERGVDDLDELSLYMLENGECSKRWLHVPFR